MEKKRDKYLSKFQLLNKTEQNLYKQLCTAAPKLIVFSQVSMSQIFHEPNKKQLFAIEKKSIDFLLCRKSDTSMLLAIELNGPHHNKETQQIGDEIKKAALNEAGIQLLTLNLNNLPTPKELGKLLAQEIDKRKKSEKAKQDGIARSKQKVLCASASCKSPISNAELTYCQSHKEHFNGKIFCKHCQHSNDTH